MQTCCYNNHLKSSVYNPSGQRYELQLTAYNAMTNHLRKVLLAKSVVDCGKVDNVSNKNIKYRRTGTSVKGVKKSLSQNVIDRLAYDTKHHPHISANTNWGFNYKDCSKYHSENKKNKRLNSAESSEGSGVREYRSSSAKSYRDERELRAGSPARKVDTGSSQPRQRGMRAAGSATGARSKENRDFEEAEIICGDIEDKEKVLDRGEEATNVKMFGNAVVPCIVPSNSRIPRPRTPEFLASTSNVSFDVLFANSQSNIKGNNASSMYIEFVYEITKEIMDKGYYSDRDIERVFEKHFKKNLRILNEEKMLQEINSLKKALSINYDSDDNDEDDLATVTCAVFPLGSSSDYSKDRKNVLSDSFGEKRKTIDKHEINERKKKLDKDSWGVKTGLDIQNTNSRDEKSSSLRSTDLQDNSTEIIISQEEVLETLLEMNLNPEKAQEIVKGLQNRSKELRSVSRHSFKEKNKEDILNIRQRKTKEEITDNMRGSTNDGKLQPIRESFTKSDDEEKERKEENEEQEEKKKKEDRVSDISEEQKKTENGGN